MYGKIFESMYDGTLYGHWQAIVTFQQMIVLADQEGVVDMTPQAMAARTSIPFEIIKAGVEFLEQPDEYSRSKAEDGRRIERLEERRPWGWRIVNYAYYRDLASREEKRKKDRERIASKRDAQRHDATGCDNDENVAGRRSESPGVANVAHADVDADADTDTPEETPLPPKGGRSRSSIVTATPFEVEVIAAYHTILPDHPKVAAWTRKRRQMLAARVADAAKRGKIADTVEYWQRYFTRVSRSDFLCGRAKAEFIADLEWLLLPTNFLKVVEGRYQNREDGNGG